MSPAAKHESNSAVCSNLVSPRTLKESYYDGKTRNVLVGMMATANNATSQRSLPQMQQQMM